ncbi:hypothetical protein [Petroclostridium sp. X23]|nr:hypothetical protein [Petroclostridium sp. X23]WHH60601.1 hypothetical protein QKW49_07800 [Petroclostridium sp. X23]
MKESNTMKAAAKKTEWLVEPAVHFCAGGYEALLIPGVGANAIA